jgi:hypothetical protein
MLQGAVETLNVGGRLNRLQMFIQTLDGSSFKKVPRNRIQVRLGLFFLRFLYGCKYAALHHAGVLFASEGHGRVSFSMACPHQQAIFKGGTDSSLCHGDSMPDPQMGEAQEVYGQVKLNKASSLPFQLESCSAIRAAVLDPSVRSLALRKHMMTVSPLASDVFI